MDAQACFRLFLGYVSVIIIMYCLTISGCPDGWTNRGNSCYFFSVDEKAYEEAENACMTLGGYLLVMEELAEYTLVKEVIQNTRIDGEYYIGLSDRANEGTFVWLTGAELNYNGGWEENEPNDANGNEDCVHFNMASNLNDLTCTEDLRYICEKHDIDDCSPNPCLNGGSCIDGINEYTCACAAGFTGEKCTTNIDDCSPNPCLNAGICTDGVNHYTCACAAGFTGENCTTNIDDCSSHPCLNGGTCIDGINAYTCTCAPGFTGDNCTTNIDECADGTHNCDTKEMCTNTVGSFTCDCDSARGYYRIENSCSQFVCNYNGAIDVHYLPADYHYFAVQNIPGGAEVECTVTQINSTSVTITECSKNLTILLAFGTYYGTETHRVVGGISMVVAEVKCVDIPGSGIVHTVNNSMQANYTVGRKVNINPGYEVTSSLNTTTTTVGSPVAWTISYSYFYILEVTSCSAYPGSNNQSPDSVSLISSGGCNVTSELITHFSDDLNGSATATIQAFTFYDSDSVFLTCDVKVCSNISSTCDTTCSREKRSARHVRSTFEGDAEGEHLATVHNVLKIVHSSACYPVSRACLSLLLTLAFIHLF
ncbi:E-selectin-like [Mercenaria mercenaria]|uniref:E-selectin-like n=1 Tax=Mercenaria mercenaria TaxID=6596 RepID=UPI00234EB80E|nr:E-selectin-like [Mercenaria mercenaria]